VFGVLSIESAVDGRPVDAAWWGLYCTLTDKLDGLVASLLNAQSAFGVQLDSLADLLSFGVVPPTVMWSFYAAHPELGWSGWPMRILSCAWVLAAAARLARFNVSARAPTHYLGMPSTMAAGWVMSCFVCALKYAAPSLTAPESFDRFRLPWRGDEFLYYTPLLLAFGAVAMLAPFRVPRLQKLRSRALTVLLLAIVVVGYSVGLFRALPEYFVVGGVIWIAVSLAYHFRARDRVT
jgi:CDP-diacylglycerol--serine O-phosphatidyltransferase